MNRNVLVLAGLLTVSMGSELFAQRVDAPELLRPLSGEQPRRFRFNWRQVNGAHRYEIMVRRLNPRTGDFDFFMRRFTNDPSYLDNLHFQRGVYRWVVRGFNNQGNPGPWSGVGDFAVGGVERPAVLRPRTDGITARNLATALEFRAVADVDRYQVQLRIPGGRVITQTVQSRAEAGRTLALMARNLQHSRNYHWRVRAGVGGIRVGDRASGVEWGPWTGWNRFSLRPPPFPAGTYRASVPNRYNLRVTVNREEQVTGAYLRVYYHDTWSSQYKYRAFTFVPRSVGSWSSITQTGSSFVVEDRWTQGWFYSSLHLIDNFEISGRLQPNGTIVGTWKADYYAKSWIGTFRNAKNGSFIARRQ